MSNPIQKSDLISDEALQALEEMSRLLREDKENMDALMASFRQYAGSIQTATNANSSNNDALTAALQRISELERAYADLQRVMRENTETRKRVNEEKRKYKKLTEDEIQSVKKAAEEYQDWVNMLHKGYDIHLVNRQEIDKEKKSYNELQQTYNALKDALNQLTTAERNNTEVGKWMTKQANSVRDTMNEMQKATGNYTLQVGKYRAAFDGLGYSMQQILREAPSALNLNQFFLAISNNIPQFLDQLKAFNAEQDDIKANLAQMIEGTKEYAEQLAKVESVGKKLGRTLMSWQTLVLVGLMIIRNWDRIVELISNLLHKISFEQKALKEVNDGAAQSVGELRAKYAALQKEWKNLKEEDMHAWIEQHKNDWNELGVSINNAKEAEDFYVNNTQSVLDAINARARSIAGMKLAAEKYEEAFRMRVKAEEDFENGKMGFGGSLMYGAASSGMAKGGTLTPQQQASIDALAKAEAKRYHDKAVAEAEKLEKEADYIITTWVLPEQINPTKSGRGRGRKEAEEKYAYEDVPDRWWDAEKELIRKMKDGYDEEIELQQLAHEKEKSELQNWLSERNTTLYNNLMTSALEMANGDKAMAEKIYNAITFKEEQTIETMSEEVQSMYFSFWYNIEEGQRQHDAIMQGLVIDNEEAIKAINQKYDKAQMDAIQAQYKAEMKVVSRRSRTVVQEQQKNTALVYNINVLRREIEALTNAQYKDNDSKEEATRRTEELNKEIDKLRKQMDFSKELGLPGSFWELLQKKGAFDATPKTMRDIVGKFLPAMVDEMDEEQIESAFETITKNIGTATKEWYSTTVGYINDLISAYVELANAKADAAREATEAAQEEYDKEKALLEAGYASRVEATWAEYQQKKAAQEKAEADAKEAAETEKQINESLTMGNLMSASAKIWEAFAAWPPVAIAALGTMWGSFIAAKTKAAEVSKYGEGGFEVLEGGSHASGNDIDLGVKNRRGRRMKAEGDEGLGIFRVRAMKHYGASTIESVVNSINRLDFESSAAKRMSIERSVGMQVFSMPRTNLRNVESDLHKLVAYGSRSQIVDKNGTVIEYRRDATIRTTKIQ